MSTSSEDRGRLGKDISSGANRLVEQAESHPVAACPPIQALVEMEIKWFAIWMSMGQMET